MGRFDGKIAIVTGGAGGLGQVAARRFATEGAKVLVVDRDGPGAESVAQDIVVAGGVAGSFTCDQRYYDQVQAMLASCMEKFSRVDILFANAGHGRFAPLIDLKPEHWRATIDANLNGTFYVVQAVSRQMAVQGEGGKIVITASSGARVQCDQLGAYCTSKAGLVMLAKSWASELGNYRINVNTILPGVIATNLTSPMLREERELNMVKRQTPMGRPGTPHDVANLVLFLASDEADYITGEDIMIDGGSTMHGFPRWFMLDYEKTNDVDWQQLASAYPYTWEK